MCPPEDSGGATGGSGSYGPGGTGGGGDASAILAYLNHWGFGSNGDYTGNAGYGGDNVGPPGSKAPEKGEHRSIDLLGTLMAPPAQSHARLGSPGIRNDGFRGVESYCGAEAPAGGLFAYVGMDVDVYSGLPSDSGIPDPFTGVPASDPFADRERATRARSTAPFAAIRQTSLLSSPYLLADNDVIACDPNRASCYPPAKSDFNQSSVANLIQAATYESNVASQAFMEGKARIVGNTEYDVPRAAAKAAQVARSDEYKLAFTVNQLRDHPMQNPTVAGNQPSLGDRLLEGLGGIPGSPFALRKDILTAMEMARAFQAEKTLGAGVVMAVNVINPLYHAEVARFKSAEAVDRGEFGKATGYGFQAIVGYVQTLGLATGLARGIVRAESVLKLSPEQPLTASPVDAINVVVAEGKPVVRTPALNIEMNIGTRAALRPLADLPQATPGSGTWATAEGVPPVRSGFGYPGYEGNLASEVFQYANANDIPLRPHGFFDRLPNLGAPGAWASTHAELKLIYRNPYVDLVEVNRTICVGCRESISQIVMQRGLPIVVLDPNGLWYFMPTGILFPPGY